MNKCHKSKFYEHFINLRFRKKAQYYRVDLLFWYVLCLFVVFLSVGTLYSFDIIGDELISTESGITGAVVVEDAEVAEAPIILDTAEIEENISITSRE